MRNTIARCIRPGTALILMLAFAPAWAANAVPEGPVLLGIPVDFILFALTLLGLGVVWLGVWWQRHEEAINARFARFVPAGLRPR